uniref:(northern house mosquito) hypothetical protein n=1 Tax=Culex pipiens TaxID=7175 RepID=A0A8D8C394_CULPI
MSQAVTVTLLGVVVIVIVVVMGVLHWLGRAVMQGLVAVVDSSRGEVSAAAGAGAGAGGAEGAISKSILVSIGRRRTSAVLILVTSERSHEIRPVRPAVAIPIVILRLGTPKARPVRFQVLCPIVTGRGTCCFTICNTLHCSIQHH